jgi:hypothetical protein
MLSASADGPHASRGADHACRRHVRGDGRRCDGRWPSGKALGGLVQRAPTVADRLGRCRAILHDDLIDEERPAFHHLREAECVGGG